MDFLYDDTGSLLGFKYNGEPYYYVKNLQGDIIEIVDGSSAEVVSYKYDSWGNLLEISGYKSATIGELNPFRYRSHKKSLKPCGFRDFSLFSLAWRVL